MTITKSPTALISTFFLSISLFGADARIDPQLGFVELNLNNITCYEMQLSDEARANRDRAGEMFRYFVTETGPSIYKLRGLEALVQSSTNLCQTLYGAGGLWPNHDLQLWPCDHNAQTRKEDAGTKLSCHQYAISMLLGDERYNEKNLHSILDDRQSNGGKNIINAISHFFRQVSRDEAKAGDLVTYHRTVNQRKAQHSKDEDEKQKFLRSVKTPDDSLYLPDHSAIYLGNNQASSKIDSNLCGVSTHGLHEIHSADIGDILIFWRLKEPTKESAKTCDNCRNVAKKLKKCSKCKVAQYCGADCQKADWKKHKLECHAPAAE